MPLNSIPPTTTVAGLRAFIIAYSRPCGPSRLTRRPPSAHARALRRNEARGGAELSGRRGLCRPPARRRRRLLGRRHTWQPGASRSWRALRVGRSLTPPRSRRAQDDLVPLIEAGVKGFKCFLIESGVDEFPCVDEDDLRKALAKLEVRRPATCRKLTLNAHRLTRATPPSVPPPGPRRAAPVPRRDGRANSG